MIAPILNAHRRFKLAWDRLRRLPWTLEYEAILAEPDRRTRFDRIYRRKIWSRIAKRRDSASGEGSSLDATSAFRDDLQSFLRGRRPGVFLDAPCGDLNFMSRVQFPPGWAYVGADIAPTLISDMRKRFPALTFREFDMTSDPFPASDVWLCRACLFHFSFADIRATLENFARSPGGLAIITSDKGIVTNTDIPTGDYRRLDLTLPPFNLPAPTIALRDLPGQIAGVWSREQIAAMLK
jgi:SAM-dependent methyltransferase